MILAQLLLISLLAAITYQENKTIVCDGNRFKHNSLYSIGRKTDLQLTFNELNKNLYHIDDLQYKQQLFRTYRIETTDMKVEISALKQDWHIVGNNFVNFTGATAKVSYSFTWFKKQLETQSSGTGYGEVVTDPLTFVKSLQINRDTNDLEWKFQGAPLISITNSLTLQKFQPYKQADYEVVNQMLNNLKNNGTTLKVLIIEALNKDYIKTLAQIVESNHDTHPEQKQIYYSYSDYHGQIDFKYNNTMLDLKLIDKTKGGGIDILMSESIEDYDAFDCGEHKVPFEPEDVKIYGGFQELLSNSFFRSNLRYALEEKKFLNIRLTEQNWQSRAFQFFMGDLHQVMPSTKNLSSLDPLTGYCEALYDEKHFTFQKASMSSYDVKINYTCSISYNSSKILGIDILVQYEVEVEAKSDHIEFMIVEIGGTPLYTEFQGYEIKNLELANFMVEQTLLQAQFSPVIGNGYPIKPRGIARAVVRGEYILIYDASIKLFLE